MRGGGARVYQHIVKGDKGAAARTPRVARLDLLGVDPRPAGNEQYGDPRVTGPARAHGRYKVVGKTTPRDPLAEGKQNVPVLK